MLSNRTVQYVVFDIRFKEYIFGRNPKNERCFQPAANPKRAPWERDTRISRLQLTTEGSRKGPKPLRLANGDGLHRVSRSAFMEGRKHEVPGPVASPAVNKAAEESPILRCARQDKESRGRWQRL